MPAAETEDAIRGPGARAGAREAPAPAATALPGIELQAHARAVLAPALPPAGTPSHAYLFHGPAGTGKRATARAFAAALLADGADDPPSAAARVQRGAHPDLTWVTRSGAAETLVSDIDEPVVAAAARTPFEASRRVFVIEAVDTLNDQAANRLLKTLEEPPAYAHLVLITERITDVLPTISSRCLHVRFDPLPAARVAGLLADVDGQRALACARLAQGDAGLAARLADTGGEELRGTARAYVRAALGGTTESRPWLGLLERAQAAGAQEAARAQERTRGEVELLPPKERRRHEREAAEAQRRSERRARTETLDLGLRLAELWLRDLLCVCEQAPELVLAVDRRDELEQEAHGLASAQLREAIELVGDTRVSLALFVNEELALEALAYRLQALFAA